MRGKETPLGIVTKFRILVGIQT